MEENPNVPSGSALWDIEKKIISIDDKEQKNILTQFKNSHNYVRMDVLEKEEYYKITVYYPINKGDLHGGVSFYNVYKKTGKSEMTGTGSHMSTKNIKED